MMKRHTGRSLSKEHAVRLMVQAEVLLAVAIKDLDQAARILDKAAEEIDQSTREEGGCGK